MQKSKKIEVSLFNKIVEYCCSDDELNVNMVLTLVKENYHQKISEKVYKDVCKKLKKEKLEEFEKIFEKYFPHYQIINGIKSLWKSEKLFAWNMYKQKGSIDCWYCGNDAKDFDYDFSIEKTTHKDEPEILVCRYCYEDNYCFYCEFCESYCNLEEPEYYVLQKRTIDFGHWSYNDLVPGIYKESVEEGNLHKWIDLKLYYEMIGVKDFSMLYDSDYQNDTPRICPDCVGNLDKPLNKILMSSVTKEAILENRENYRRLLHMKIMEKGALQLSTNNR